MYLGNSQSLKMNIKILSMIGNICLFVQDYEYKLKLQSSVLIILILNAILIISALFNLYSFIKDLFLRFVFEINKSASIHFIYILLPDHHYLATFQSVTTFPMNSFVFQY